MNTLKRRAVILLAEDDPGDQELTRRALEGGKILNDLYIVQDGEEALDYLLRRGKYTDPATSPSPDLFLLDLNMPRMDGRRVLETMRSTPDCPQPAIIVLTTSSQEEDVIHSYGLGVKSYITKPVDVGAFLRALKLLQEYWLEIVVLPPKQG